jgi:enamine deaminase RidA (YjgF/YER057c/UK114 family)
MRNILHPPGWARARGYSSGVAATGTQVFIAGQIGWNAQQQFESDELVAQVRQALANVLAVLREADGGPEHIARMTWYLVDKRDYLAKAALIGAAYRELMRDAGGTVQYPATTAVEVRALIEDRALVEIECTAVVPAPEPLAQGTGGGN